MSTVKRIETRQIKQFQRKRVAAYARVSVDTEQLMHSLSAQVSYYSNLIQRTPEWEYVGVYIDAGITGTDTKPRERFQEMIADCEAGKIDIILTKSISRFARNTVDLLATVRHLKELGVEVRFEREHVNTFTSDGEVMLSILAKLMKDARESYETQVLDEKNEAFDKKFRKDRNTLEIASNDIVDWDFSTFDCGEQNRKKLLRIRTKELEYADENGIMDYVVEDMAFVLDLPEKIITDESAFEEYYQPYIEAMKEEGKRKKQLIDKIVKSVPDDGNI